MGALGGLERPGGWDLVVAAPRLARGTAVRAGPRQPHRRLDQCEVERCLRGGAIEPAGARASSQTSCWCHSSSAALRPRDPHSGGVPQWWHGRAPDPRENPSLTRCSRTMAPRPRRGAQGRRRQCCAGAGWPPTKACAGSGSPSFVVAEESWSWHSMTTFALNATGSSYSLTSSGVDEPTKSTGRTRSMRVPLRARGIRCFFYLRGPLYRLNCFFPLVRTLQGSGIFVLSGKQQARQPLVSERLANRSKLPFSRKLS